MVLSVVKGGPQDNGDEYGNDDIFHGLISKG
jgi:hypothetical protein